MRNIIILGSGPGWESCPFDRETWVVAKMLMQDKPLARIDMLFSMDDADHWLTVRRGIFTIEDFKAKVNATGAPYYSSVKTPGIDVAREYPLKDVLSRCKVPYFSNTVAYMIAYAIYQKVDSITLYGIAQIAASEYISERGCVEFWIGMALGMGIEVNIATHSALLKNGSQYPYGYVRTLQELREDGKI
jgi:hypothetical protein